MDQTLEQLVDNVARYLKQGVTDSSIRKGLKNNNWDEQMFDQALRMAKTRLRQEEAVAQEAAKLAEEAKHPRKVKKNHKKDSSSLAGKDTPSHSTPTAPLPQDEAVLLHQAIEAALPAESERQALPKGLEGLEELEGLEGLENLKAPEEVAPDIAALSDMSAFFPPGPPAPYAPTPWQQLQQPPAPGMPAYPYNPPVWPAPIPPSPATGFYPTNPASPNNYYNYPNAYPAGWPSAQYPQPQPQPLQGAYPYPVNPGSYQTYPQPSPGDGGQPFVMTTPSTSFSAHLPQGVSGYPVVQALKDTFQAVKANLVTYLLTVLVCAIAAGALFFLAHMMVVPLKYNYLLTAPTKLLGIMLRSFALYSIACTLLATLMVAITSVAIYSSGAQKRKSSINVVLSKSMAKISMVGAATALLATLTFVPPALGILLPVTFLLKAHAAASMAYVLPLLYVLAVGWIVLISRRYALVPYIALFERDVSLGQMLVRSRRLLSDGGRWFMTQITLGMFVLLLLATYISGGSLRQLTNKIDIPVVVLACILSLIFNATLVMLYRNQKSLEQ